MLNEVKFGNAGKTHFSIQSALTAGFMKIITGCQNILPT